MAHVTGNANDIAALLTAIRNACTANGWTLAGNVLHKGGIYVHIVVNGATLRITGGTGIDGGNNLTGAAPGAARLKSMGTTNVITYPVTYEVHINTAPDEVYVVVNFNVDFYLFMAWGKSDVAGLPGSGVWFSASGGDVSSTVADTFIIGSGGIINAGSGMPLFFATQSLGLQNTYIHHDLDALGWTQLGTAPAPSAFAYLEPLQLLLPNNWNNETILLPYPVFVPRSSGNKVSLVADLKHVRLCRNDFHPPGDIIALGSDQWKVYPWFKKDTVTRTPQLQNGATHSGTFAWAVRYTGA